MRHLPLLVLLAACGDSYTKPWAGTCAETSVGDIGMSTGNMIRSEGSAPQWEGEHTFYSGHGQLNFPESDQEVSVELVICDDPDGCQAPTTDYDDGDLIATFLDDSGNVLLTGWGELLGHDVTGDCTSSFGLGKFTFGKERKGGSSE